ncbi:MAG: transposase [Chloroflexi bacterium]|nr:transposase [Chloroflexota bacterium]
MPRGRTFSREFKLELMHQLASGAQRPAQMCREHGLANSVLSRWRHEYAERGEGAFAPQQPNSEEALHRRIAELERFCGQLALENQALKKGLGSMTSRSGTP